MSLKDKVTPGKNPPDEIYAVIEIPQGSRVKYELHKTLGVVFVNRILYTSMFYPFNYGFIPQTLHDDEDPIDVLVMGHEPLIPTSVISCKPIGLLKMKDEAGYDSKVIAVPTSDVDPRFDDVQEIDDLPKQTKDEIWHFFKRYKELEPEKWVEVKKWKNAEGARKEIIGAIEAYKKHSC